MNKTYFLYKASLLIVVSTILTLCIVFTIVFAGQRATAGEAGSVNCCAVAGDADHNGRVNIGDVTFLIARMFSGGEAPFCFDEGDASADGKINIGDVTYIIANLFLGGPAPTCIDGVLPSSSSYSIIDSVLAAGGIDYETSLTYKIFALYGDGRLPVEFQGNNSSVREVGVEREITRQWNSLSVTTQDLVGPYVVNPIYDGSWLNLNPAGARSASTCLPWKDPCSVNPSWLFIDSDNGRVRIWYNVSDSITDAPKARGVASAIDNHIYPKLVPLMGREPDNDAGYKNNGGNDRLDIVLIAGLGSEGESSSLPGSSAKCSDWPPLIKIKRTLTGGSLHATVAHEVMHVILFNFPADCWEDEYDWMHEATATWAEHYVYADTNTEHEYASSFLHHTNESLDWNPGGNVLFHYGANIFFLYLQQFSANWIPAIWNASTTSDPLAGIQAGLTAAGSTNFGERWPQFARRNWNVAPNDKYNQWDNLTETVPDTAVTLTLSGKTDDTLSMDVGRLKYLSARYFHYIIPNDDISSLTFINGMKYYITKTTNADGVAYYEPQILPANATEGLSVELYYKIAGRDWQFDTVTNEASVVFCRDQIMGRLEELVVIYANSNHDPSSTPLRSHGLKPLLYVSNAGCWNWKGTVNVVQTTCKTTTLNSNMEWKSLFGSLVNRKLRPEGNSEYASLSVSVPFMPSAGTGTYTWNVTGDCGSCTITGDDSWPVTMPQANILTVYPGAYSGTYARGLDFGGFNPGPFNFGTEHYVCPDENHDVTGMISINAGTESPDHGLRLSADGRRITGSIDKGTGVVITFNLTAQRE